MGGTPCVVLRVENMYVIEPLFPVPSTKNKKFPCPFDHRRTMIRPGLRHRPVRLNLPPHVRRHVQRMKIVQIFSPVPPPEHVHLLPMSDIIRRMHVARPRRRPPHLRTDPLQVHHAVGHVEHVCVRRGQGTRAEPSPDDHHVRRPVAEDRQRGSVPVASRGGGSGDAAGVDGAPAPPADVEGAQRRVVATAVVSAVDVDDAVVVSGGVVLDRGGAVGDDGEAVRGVAGF
mmetsp:Transcript_34412/g.79564  ORF Transcript_34412/g.79564 Transcript_34412/m.79564 type:complete len:229 (+) Transcript_34412:1490-2176(+)